MAECLFLETTVQIEKIFAEKEKRAALISFLDGANKKTTSNYVLDQFKSTFVNAALLFHKLLIDSPDVHTAVKRAERYHGEGRIKKLNSIFYKLCEEVGYDKQAALDRLEIWLEVGLIEEFFNGIDEVIDETKCCRVKSEPVKKGRFYEMESSCNKTSPPPCSIPAFWEKNKVLLGKISSNLDVTSDKKELEKVKEVAKKIYEETDSPYGINCSVHLSDTVIAIEAPVDSDILTTNDKHFAPICSAINKKHIKWSK